MAVSPNTTCGSFCTWILATAWLKATATQKALVTTVQTAAGISGTVSDHTWNEFLRITGLWFKYYQSYILQTTQYATLPSGIVQGDTLYGSASNVLSRLAKSTTASSFIKNSGTNNNPAWARPAFADLSDFTPLTDYSSTTVVTGFSSISNKNVWYTVCGGIVTLTFYIQGTSNSSVFYFTAPFNANNSMSPYYTTARCQNNSITPTTPAMCYILGGDNRVTCLRDNASTAWTNVNSKYAAGVLVYPKA